MYELFQKLNKVSINENSLYETLLDKLFNKLINNKMKIQLVKTKVNNNVNDVEILATDDNNNKVFFKFNVIGGEEIDDGVYGIDSANIIEFDYKSKDFNVLLTKEMPVLNKFNETHRDDIIEFVNSYVDFDKENNNELYSETISIIDSIVEKSINEYDDEDEDSWLDDEYTSNDNNVDDPLALPPDYGDADVHNLSNDDDMDDYEKIKNSIEYGNYNINNDDEGNDDSDDVFGQAVNNLIAKNRSNKNPKYYPTKYEIDKEIENILKTNKKKNDEPEKPKGFGNMMAKGKKRVYPNWAYDYIPISELELKSVDIDDLIKNYLNNANDKDYYIKLAIKYLNDKGINLKNTSKNEYYDLIRNIVVHTYKTVLKYMNESDNDDLSYVQKLAIEKKKRGEIIKGGLGDGKSPLEFNPEQIKLGMKVEMEHTNDPMIAIEIVLDHLSEDSEYYTRKEDPESSAQFGASNDAENDSDENDAIKNNVNIKDADKNMTDILLGYKSKKKM